MDVRPVFNGARAAMRISTAAFVLTALMLGLWPEAVVVASLVASFEALIIVFGLVGARFSSSGAG